MRNIINLIVADNEHNQRVDQFLTKKEKNLSRTRIKNLIINNNLKINKIIVKNPAKKIASGDNINLKIPKPKKVSLKPYNYKLEIIYEDNDLIIINKAAGIAMHPGAGNYDNTLVNALINYGSKNLSNIGDELRPGIVHRIDKDTSGLVVIAKNNFTHEELSKQFNEHSINRTYQTLIWGKLRPKNGKIETLITRSTKNRQLMAVGITKGKKAITNYKTLEIFENPKCPLFSFVECKLETGRTHQIRVHLEHINNNIVGDKVYGKKKINKKNDSKLIEKLLLSNFNRQALHAYFLGFNHPRSNKYIEFTSVFPTDFDELLKHLSKY